MVPNTARRVSAHARAFQRVRNFPDDMHSAYHVHSVLEGLLQWLTIGNAPCAGAGYESITITSAELRDAAGIPSSNSSTGLISKLQRIFRPPSFLSINFSCSLPLSARDFSAHPSMSPSHELNRLFFRGFVFFETHSLGHFRAIPGRNGLHGVWCFRGYCSLCRRRCALAKLQKRRELGHAHAAIPAALLLC